MVLSGQMNNGQTVVMCAAEILSIPHYELLNEQLENANIQVQTAFTQMINGFSRQMVKEQTSIEFLWQSIPTANQTYAAEIRMFVIFRSYGADSLKASMTAYIEKLMKSFRDDLAVLNYDCREFEQEEEYKTLHRSLAANHTEKTYSVARREFSIPMYNSYVYYTNPVQPSSNINISSITNALTSYPNSVISMQLIPTEYTPEEIQLLEMTKSQVNVVSNSMRFQRGPHQDPTMQTVQNFYEMTAMNARDAAFLYNILIYSDSNGAAALGSKVIEQMEDVNRNYGTAFELVPVEQTCSNAGQDFMLSPWIRSRQLVYQLREPSFWRNPAAPVGLIRLRYLLGTKELKTVFKLPIDDGHTIGIHSRRTKSNVEKLNSKILSEGGFKLGRIRNTTKGSGMIDAGIPLDDFTKHGLIVGMPGTGKTNFSLGFLIQMWKDFHIPFLVIEPTKNEYRSLVDAIPDLQTFTPGKGHVSPYIINPFLPPSNVTVETYAPGLMTSFKAAFNMPNPLPNVFMNAINAAYTEYGWKKSSTSADPDATPFGMYEFIRVFKRIAGGLGYQGESKSNIESAGVLRLMSLIEQNINIYDTIHTIPLEDLLSRPTVIELNAIADKEQKSLIMAFLLMMVCVHTKNNMIGDGTLKNIILIDEAHVLLEKGAGGESDTRAATISTIEDMIAEIRALGTGIIIADQSPVKIGKYIVANTNVKMMFKLVEKESRDIISVTTNMDETEYEEMARLGVGQAMCHFGRLNSPLQVATYNVEDVYPIRKVVSDEEVAKLCQYWKDPEHRKLLIPHRECEHNCFCSQGCSLRLRDDAEFIAESLRQRYPEKLTDKKTFMQFLVSMSTEIRQIVESRPSMELSKQLINCTKIKYFRKALLDIKFPFTAEDYETVVHHPKFMMEKENRIQKQYTLPERRGRMNSTGKKPIRND